VNLRDLERFDAGVEVTPELLKTAGVIKSLRHPVKILGDGELTRVLTVRAHAFSKRAVELIEASGGTVVVIPGGPNPNNSPSSKTRAANRKSAAAAAAGEAPAEPVPEEPTEEPAAESEPEPEE